MAYVYRHVRLDKNEVFYVGIGLNDNFGKYKRAHSFARSNFWKKITNKSEYVVEIMFDDLTWEEACEKEKEFIKIYGRKDLNEGTLVNLTDGGDGSLNVSPESRKKQSEMMKNSFRDEKYRKNISIAKTGYKNPMYGKPSHRSKKVLQYDRNNNFINEFKDAYEAMKLVKGTRHNHIAACCRNERKTHKKFIWKYKLI